MPERAPAAVPACDVLVVGGGINGAGIARDLAGRGAKVVLVERDDLGQHTSSASTKLIHGGLRYLEHYEFGLVRKALAEREVLLRNAPHIVRPLRFVMPHDPAMRPVWMIRTGLFLYDHLARRELLPPSATVDLRVHDAGAPLKTGFTRGFVYSDGWVDDSRLVLLNALDAAERGATVLTRSGCRAVRRAGAGWHATLQSADGRTFTLPARAVVNATGPWAAQFLAEQASAAAPRTLRLVKGSHVIVPRLFAHDLAYLFQNPDQRIIFVIPYEGCFSLIGTTDVEHPGAPGDVRASADEVAYLCAQASRYFERPVAPADVVRAYSGVRPLLDDDSGDPSAVTRDYALEFEAGDAPLLNVWGGKITTYRRLAEEAVAMLAAPLGLPRSGWTDHAPLPGGDLADAHGGTSRPDASFDLFVQALLARHGHRPAALVQRLARQYGSRAGRVLDRGELGAEVAPGLFEAELVHLHDAEWARNADDVLWRRTKLGLHYSDAERDAVARWCAERWPDHAAPTPGAWG